MKEVLHVVGGFLTPLIAVIAVYIAIQQHNLQRDKLRLDLYEKRMAVFIRTTDLLDAWSTYLLDPAEGEVEYRKAFGRFLTGTANAEFLFGPEIKEYLEKVPKELHHHKALHDRRVKEAEKGQLSGVDSELKEMEWLLAEAEKETVLFAPYMAFGAIRGSAETAASSERVLFRLLLLTVVGSILGFGAAALRASQRSEAAFNVSQTYNKMLLRDETVCATRPESVLCDPSDRKSYQTEMEAALAEARDQDDLSDRLTTLAWAVPLGCVFAFYAGRWVVTGIKPRPRLPWSRAKAA